MVNVSYIWAPKFISPFGDDEIYLVPAVSDQQGKENNYIVVCCSPSYNGLYKCPAAEYKNFETWTNNKRKCYYVPISKCEYVKPLEDIQMTPVREKIRKIQLTWQKNKNRKNTPDWFITQE